jgi:hypothetical protein
MGSSELIRCGLPKNPVRHWGQFAMDCLNKSKAKVVLIACEAATLTYLDHIREEGVNHTLIWIFGTRRYESKTPVAIKEYVRGTVKEVISRLLIVTAHPEAFIVGRFKVWETRSAHFASQNG